jgi:ABC-type xylose transport system permease subunit
MPLPTLSRNTRLAILAVGLGLIVWLEWVVVLDSTNWHSRYWSNFVPEWLGKALLVVMIFMISMLGFEEEDRRARDSLYHYSFLIQLFFAVAILGIIFVGAPLLLFFSFFTDSPYIPLVLTVVLAAGYFFWKKYRLRLRQN